MVAKGSVSRSNDFCLDGPGKLQLLTPGRICQLGPAGRGSHLRHLPRGLHRRIGTDPASRPCRASAGPSTYLGVSPTLERAQSHSTLQTEAGTAGL